MPEDDDLEIEVGGIGHEAPPELEAKEKPRIQLELPEADIKVAGDIIKRVQSVRDAIKRTEGMADFLDKKGVEAGIGAVAELVYLDLPVDIAMAGPALWIVYRGWKAGLSRKAIAEMLGNIGIDLAVDTVGGLGIPFLGSLFDFLWKANTKNVEIMRKEAARLEGEYQKITGKSVDDAIRGLQRAPQEEDSSSRK